MIIGKKEKIGQLVEVLTLSSRTPSKIIFKYPRLLSAVVCLVVGGAFCAIYISLLNDSPAEAQKLFPGYVCLGVAILGAVTAIVAWHTDITLLLDKARGVIDYNISKPGLRKRTKYVFKDAQSVQLLLLLDSDKIPEWHIYLVMNDGIKVGLRFQFWNMNFREKKKALDFAKGVATFLDCTLDVPEKENEAVALEAQLVYRTMDKDGFVRRRRTE